MLQTRWKFLKILTFLSYRCRTFKLKFFFYLPYNSLRNQNSGTLFSYFKFNVTRVYTTLSRPTQNINLLSTSFLFFCLTEEYSIYIGAELWKYVVSNFQGTVPYNYNYCVIANNYYTHCKRNIPTRPTRRRTHHDRNIRRRLIGTFRFCTGTGIRPGHVGKHREPGSTGTVAGVSTRTAERPYYRYRRQLRARLHRTGLQTHLTCPCTSLRRCTTRTRADIGRRRTGTYTPDSLCNAISKIF